MTDQLDPHIWLKNGWFFLYSVAHCYPDYPNDVTKRKYYDFVQNFPLFIPNDELQKKFISLLDTFPVTPYLDNKDSFTYWVHFIQNKLNYEIGQPEKTFHQHLDDYYDEYIPQPIVVSQKWKIQKKYLVWGVLAICFSFILYFS